MSISVNKDMCIGCGVCAAICPASFLISDEGKAEVKGEQVSDCALKAAESCPVRAINT